MRMDARRWALHHQWPSGPEALLPLACMANRRGKCWSRQENLAQVCGRIVRAVMKCAALLRMADWAAVVPCTRTHPTGRGHTHDARQRREDEP